MHIRWMGSWNNGIQMVYMIIQWSDHLSKVCCNYDVRWKIWSICYRVTILTCKLIKSPKLIIIVSSNGHHYHQMDVKDYILQDSMMMDIFNMFVFMFVNRTTKMMLMTKKKKIRKLRRRWMNWRMKKKPFRRRPLRQHLHRRDDIEESNLI